MAIRFATEILEFLLANLSMFWCCPSTNVDACELSFAERLQFFQHLPKPASIPVQAALGDDCFCTDDLEESVDEFGPPLSSNAEADSTFGSQIEIKEAEIKHLENSLEIFKTSRF